MPKAGNERKTLLGSLDALVAKYHLLKHPFYRAWTEGKLSKQSLGLYAQQYYQHVQAFPENLKQLASRTNGDAELKSLVLENLAEELDETATHPELWRRFASSLGVSDVSLDSAQPLPGISALLDSYDEVSTQGTLAQAVAAFYVYEAQVPEIATEKISGLRKFYGITDSRSLSYFSVHEEADVRHRAAWREWLGNQKSADTVAVLCAAERSLKALWGALDAVYPEGCASSKN
jgi:pyrroloquinoline-quinone synthase